MARTEAPNLGQVVLTRRLLKAGLGKELRLRSGLSIREIADRVGVDRAQLSRWERGLRAPRPANAARYAAALGEFLDVVDLEAAIAKLEPGSTADR